MTDTDLRRLAEQATPGPWVMQKPGDNDPGAGTIFIDTHAHEFGPEPVIAPTYPIAENDAAYIAAANPQAILALLDAFDRANEAIGEAAAVNQAAERRVAALTKIADTRTESIIRLNSRVAALEEGLRIMLAADRWTIGAAREKARALLAERSDWYERDAQAFARAHRQTEEAGDGQR